MTRKLTFLAIIIVFVFLTGGIKYRGRTYGYYNQKEMRFIRTGHSVKEIRVLGFYCREIEKSDRLEMSYGWSLEPSLRIVSITTYQEYR